MAASNENGGLVKPMMPMGMKRKPVMKPGTRMMSKTPKMLDMDPMMPMPKAKKAKPMFGKGVLTRINKAI